MPKMVYTPGKGLISKPGKGFEINGVPVTRSSESMTTVGSESSDTTTGANDILLLTTGGAHTILLADGVVPGQELILIVQSGGHTIAVENSDSSALASGAFSKAMVTGDVFVFMWNGTKWYALAE